MGYEVVVPRRAAKSILVGTESDPHFERGDIALGQVFLQLFRHDNELFLGLRNGDTELLENVLAIKDSPKEQTMGMPHCFPSTDHC